MRGEYPVIVNLVRTHSRVIDLGCGNGALLALLKKEKSVSVVGVEISESGIKQCRRRKLKVRRARIDQPLPFKDNEFDYAICNVTIQMVMYPEVLLKEMRRVARYQIVSFPNFAFWRNRLELLMKGRMPWKMLFGYSWYSTGHIHQLSFVDFEQLVHDVGGIRIVKQELQGSENPLINALLHHYPNFFQMLGVYFLERV